MSESNSSEKYSMKIQSGGLKTLADQKLAYVAVVLTIIWFSYFSLRFLVNDVIPREAFTMILGSLIFALGILIFLKIRTGRVILGITVYACYVIIQFLIRNQWDEIHVIALGQYLVPIAFSVIGIYLWKKNLYKIIIKVFLITAFISILGGLANLHLGWGESFFLLNILDRVEVGSEILQRGGSLAGGSLVTGFIVMAGILLSLWNGMFYKLMIPFFVLSLFSTLSRGSLVMLFVGFIVIILLRTSKKRPFSLNNRGILPRLSPNILLLFISLTVISLFSTRDAFIERFFIDLFDFQMELGNIVRVESWIEATTIWLQNPLFGQGVGILGTTAVIREISPLAAESMYLQILGELGLIGMFVYLGAIVPPLFLAWKGLKKLQKRVQAQGLVRMLLACVVAILVGGLYLQNLGDFTGSLFWYFFGGIAGYVKETCNSGNDLRGKSYWAQGSNNA